MKALLVSIVLVLLTTAGLSVLQQNRRARVAEASTRLEAVCNNAALVVRPCLDELGRFFNFASSDWRERTDQIQNSSNLLHLTEARLRRVEEERSQESTRAASQFARYEQERDGLRSQNVVLSDMLGQFKKSLNESGTLLARATEGRQAAEAELARLRIEKASLDNQLAAALAKMKHILITGENRLAVAEEGRLEALGEVARLRSQQVALEQKLRTLQKQPASVLASAPSTPAATPAAAVPTLASVSHSTPMSTPPPSRTMAQTENVKLRPIKSKPAYTVQPAAFRYSERKGAEMLSKSLTAAW